MFRGPVKLLSSFLEGGKGEAGLAAKLKEVGGWIVIISHHHQSHLTRYNINNNIYFLHLHNYQQKKQQTNKQNNDRQKKQKTDKQTKQWSAKWWTGGSRRRGARVEVESSGGGKSTWGRFLIFIIFIVIIKWKIKKVWWTSITRWQKCKPAARTRLLQGWEISSIRCSVKIILCFLLSNFTFVKVLPDIVGLPNQLA